MSLEKSRSHNWLLKKVFNNLTCDIMGPCVFKVVCACFHKSRIFLITEVNNEM